MAGPAGVEVVRKVECGEGREIVLARGDVIRVTGCDAVVCPANSLMYMGGGVAGALRRAAGEEVEREARRRAPVPVGKAIVTGAGALEAYRYIIHAPTMERPAMRTTPGKVAKAAAAALREAERIGAECVVFPAMGAGVGGLSAEESMKAMLEALDEHWEGRPAAPRVVVFVAYTEGDARQMIRALEKARLKSCKPSRGEG